jgi:hypothetical protein
MWGSIFSHSATARSLFKKRQLRGFEKDNTWGSYTGWTTVANKINGKTFSFAAREMSGHRTLLI